MRYQLDHRGTPNHLRIHGNEWVVYLASVLVTLGKYGWGEIYKKHSYFELIWIQTFKFEVRCYNYIPHNEYLHYIFCQIMSTKNKHYSHVCLVYNLLTTGFVIDLHNSYIYIYFKHGGQFKSGIDSQFQFWNWLFKKRWNWNWEISNWNWSFIQKN